MNTDNDDTNKLLGQIKLHDFTYRAFRRNEPAPLRIVRSGSPAEPAGIAVAPKVEVSAADAPPAVSISVVAPVELARPAILPPTRVSEAFERLARVNSNAGTPRLHLQLALPKRPPLASRDQARTPSERRWPEVFDLLRQAALPKFAPSKTVQGN